MPMLILNSKKNTKIEIRPILSYRGSFPSHLVRTVKLRVRISSITNTAALRRGYRALSNASPSTPLEQLCFRRSWRQDLVNNTGKMTPKSASTPPRSRAREPSIQLLAFHLDRADRLLEQTQRHAYGCTAPALRRSSAKKFLLGG